MMHTTFGGCATHALTGLWINYFRSVYSAKCEEYNGSFMYYAVSSWSSSESSASLWRRERSWQYQGSLYIVDIFDVFLNLAYKIQAKILMTSFSTPSRKVFRQYLSPVLTNHMLAIRVNIEDTDSFVSSKTASCYLQNHTIIFQMHLHPYNEYRTE